MGWEMIEDDWSAGASAYERWAASLRQRPGVIPFGNAYNAQCWAEARRLAERFVERVAARNEHVPLLRDAHAALKRCADALQQVAKAFPFPGKEQDLSETAARQAADALREAKAGDVDAIAALRSALASWNRPRRSPGDAE
jgi:hypothetical protein